MVLRAEQARLLGYDSFAAYRLDDTMAKTPEAAAALLRAVWEPAKRKAAEERAELEAMARADGLNEPIAPWDWRYYAEKVRQAKYAHDEASVKPYFVLDNIVQAAFDTAGRLFGLRFIERRDCPVYHPDVRAYARRRRSSDRPVSARQFREAGKAHRRLDEQLPRAAKPRWRGAADRRQQQQLFEGRPDAPQLRRRAHPVPRVWPRSARPPLARPLPIAVRHRGAARLCRVPVAGLRALVRSTRHAAPLCPALPNGRALARGASAAAARGAHLRPVFRDRRVCRLLDARFR